MVNLFVKSTVLFIFGSPAGEPMQSRGVRRPLAGHV
jgi:hypothetical protein